MWIKSKNFWKEFICETLCFHEHMIDIDWTENIRDTNGAFTGYVCKKCKKLKVK